MRADGSHQQGVAIAGRPGHDLCAHVASGARPVVHDELLAKRTAKVRHQRTRQDVGSAAGRKGHDDAHRLGGSGALGMRGWQHRECAAERDSRQGGKAAATEGVDAWGHGVPFREDPSGSTRLGSGGAGG